LANRGFSVGTKATLFTYKIVVKWWGRKRPHCFC
jgi:hypothetical protein